MPCKQNHEQLTTKFCSDCGAKRIEQQQLTEDDIAKQLNEMVQEVIKESGKGIFYANACNHPGLLLEKIVARKLIIPDNMVFIITANSPNHIITMKELYEAYPDLKNVERTTFLNCRRPFMKIFPFLFACGRYENSKFSNDLLDKMTKTFNTDETFKSSGLPITVLLDESYYDAMNVLDTTKKTVFGCNKDLLKFLLKQIDT